MTLENETKSHILQLQAASQQNRLVIFVGAGVSASAGVPVWRDLVDALKNELPESMKDSDDMLKIAQMYRELRGDVEYLKTIKKILKAGEVGHTPIHDIIMKLNPCHIVTTNYDDLLEQATLSNNKQYYVVAKDEQLPANQGEKILVKMHGDFSNENIVLAENDYYDYSRNFPLIRSFLLSLFSTKVVLFVGFSFEDINLKYILREVSSILNEKMQRAYLLVDEQKSQLEYSYFQKKGIQLLWLPNTLTSGLLDKNILNQAFSDNKATALYRGLACLYYYDQFDGNLMDRTINFLDKYENQVRFWGKHLALAFPEDRSFGFDITQGKMTLPNDYKEWFDKMVSQKDFQNEFVNEHKDEIERLLDALIDNGVTTIDEERITNAERLLRHRRKDNDSAINLIYGLDFEKTEQRLRELYARSSDQTIDDLELPYLLFKLGKHCEAYEAYDLLSSEMWEHKKYILYFICLYNIKALKRAVVAKMSINRDVRAANITKKIDAINLKEILCDLPIEKRVKQLFEELISGQMLMRSRVETDRLKEERSTYQGNIRRDKVSNNMDAILLDPFDQLFLFSNKNFILTECHDYSRDAYISMSKGVLKSVMTNDGAGRTKKLIRQNVRLFVFMTQPDDLEKILGRIDEPIPAEIGFADELERMVENIANESTKSPMLMDSALLSAYLKNIIMLINIVKNPLSIPKIYCSIIKFWQSGGFWGFVSELNKLYHRQKPSAKEAIELINCVMGTKTMTSSIRVIEYVALLGSTAKRENEVLNDFMSIEQITKQKNIVKVAAFLWTVPEKHRKELIDYLREHVDNIYDLCLMELCTRAHIITPDLFIKLCDSVATKKRITLR